ncbi:MAG: hypothetical protein ABSC64_02375 [Candidatus Korobacteraceae bacterium]|jgi:hypothetical protein
MAENDIEILQNSIFMMLGMVMAATMDANAKSLCFNGLMQLLGYIRGNVTEVAPIYA